jgi:hypothetical protein
MNEEEKEPTKEEIFDIENTQVSQDEFVILLSRKMDNFMSALDERTIPTRTLKEWWKQFYFTKASTEPNQPVEIKDAN